MDSATKGKIVLDRRIASGIQHVSDLWFPVNGRLLRQIQGGLADGSYEGQVGQLLRDVRGDFSLFMHCVRQLAALVRESSQEQDVPVRPIELFEAASYEQLREVLSVDEAALSRHSISSLDDAQLGCLRSALVSASTAEVLCQAQAIDPDLGYSLALFRQLGLTLVVWNYPGIYQRATAMLAEHGTIDRAISHLLGYSPSLLAFRMLKGWGIAPSLLSLINEDADADFEEEAQADETARALSTICRVGEALARANDPALYPTAASDWDFARGEIEKLVGPQGLSLIHERFVQHSTVYLDVIPAAFKPAMVLDPEIRQARHRADEFRRLNPYIDRCREVLQRELVDLYESLSRQGPSRSALAKLLQHIVPKAGFTAGCVYTIEPILAELMPRYHFGALLGRKEGAVSLLERKDLVVLAYERGILQMGEFPHESGAVFRSLAGIFGYSQRVGVLYLELPESVYAQSPDVRDYELKAITQTLNDCLGLR